MRRRILGILAVAIVAACASPLFGASVDFGGSFMNSSGPGYFSGVGASPSSPALVQRDIGTLWFQAGSDEILFSAQASAVYNFNQINLVTGLPEALFYLDADLFNLKGTFASPQKGTSLFRFSIGRDLFSDFTGLVLFHKADGMAFEFAYPALSVNVAVGYTGLIVKPSASIALSRADVNDSLNPAIFFAPPRLLETIQLTFPSIFGQQLVIMGVFQEDLRGTALDLATAGKSPLVQAGSTVFDPTRGGRVNNQYLGLGLDGVIVGSLFYSLFSYIETGDALVWNGTSYQDSFFMAALGGAGLRYYLPNLLFSIISAKLIYVSGDAGATSVVEGYASTKFTGLTYFSPISRPTLGYVFSPQLSNVMVGEASYSVKPLSFLSVDVKDSLQTSVKVDSYFRTTAGAISEPGLAAGDTSLYLGTEADLTVTYKPFSDLAATLWGGMFLPGSAFGAGAALQYKAGLDLSLSF